MPCKSASRRILWCLFHGKNSVKISNLHRSACLPWRWSDCMSQKIGRHEARHVILFYRPCAQVQGTSTCSPPPKAIHRPCVRNVYMTPQPQSHMDRYCVALGMYASALPPNQPHGMCGVIGIIRLTGEPCVCRVSGHAADPVMSVGHLAMASSKCYYTVSYCVSWKNNNTNTNEYKCVDRHQLVCFAAALKGWRRDPIPSLLSEKWALRP